MPAGERGAFLFGVGEDIGVIRLYKFCWAVGFMLAFWKGSFLFPLAIR